MTAIIKDDAPPLDPPLPAPLRWVIERLLEKDPEERYASTKDLARDLRTMRERLSEASGSVAPVVAAKRRPLWPFLLAAGCLVAGAALALALIPPSETDISHYRFTPLAREEATEFDPEWSPDGKTIAYQAIIHGVNQLFTRAIGSANAAQITHSSRSCFRQFWSPDGLTVYYCSGVDLWAVAASGGTPRLVMKNGGWAAIHPDGKTFAFSRSGKVRIGPLDEAKQYEYRREPFPAQPGVNDLKFSNDGSKLAVTLAGRSGNEGELWILPFPSGTPRRGAQRTLQSVSWFPDNRRLLLILLAEGKFSAVVLDTVTGRERTIWSNPEFLGPSAASPDGKRIAFTAGAALWDIVEISLPEGRVSNMLAKGGMSASPDWSPSGTHYLHTTDARGHAIEDRSATEGFARVLISIGSEGLTASTRFVLDPRWAHDGQRFAFVAASFPGYGQVWVSNASGSRPFPLDAAADRSNAPSWSPDGEWIAYIRSKDRKTHLAKIRASPGATPIILQDGVTGARLQTHWSPAGDWILYSSADGLSLASPDGKSQRKLSARRFAAYGFSKSGEQVIGVFHNMAPDQAEWELYSVDVKMGSERRLAALNLPQNVGDLAGFSLHPDGKRFATSVGHWPYDIWMLEGFDQQKSWLDLLLRR